MSNQPKIYQDPDGADFFGDSEGDSAALASASQEMLSRIWERSALRSESGRLPVIDDPVDDISTFAQGAIEKLVVVELEEPAVGEESLREAVPGPAHSMLLQDPEPLPEPAAPAVEHPEQPMLQAERVVDVLFDRMEAVLEARLKDISDRAKASASVLDAEVKHNIAQFVQSELPIVIREELGSLMRTEMDRSMSAPITEESKREFSGLSKQMSKILDKFEALDRRMLHLENRKQEITVNIPKGAVNVTAPITIPEREVKVMAPITVHSPEVVFDEKAINVTFQKNGDRVTRKIDFERDRDNNIKCAKIADVQNPEK